MRGVVCCVLLLAGCGTSTTSPTTLEALPLRAGAYSMTFGGFRLATSVVQPPNCPGIPANIDVTTSVALAASGSTWVAPMLGTAGAETGRVTFDPRPQRDAPAFSAAATGSAVVLLPDFSYRSITLGSGGGRVTGAVSPSGDSATGRVEGVIVVSWAGPLGPTYACAADQASFDLKRAS